MKFAFTPSSDQFTSSQPVSLIFILILSFHLHLPIARGVFPHEVKMTPMVVKINREVRALHIPSMLRW